MNASAISPLDTESAALYKQKRGRHDERRNGMNQRGSLRSLMKSYLCSLLKAVTLCFAGVLVLVPPALAENGVKDCVSVATLFEEPLCKNDIELEARHIDDVSAEYEKQGLDPEKAIHDRNMARLKTLVWQKSLLKEFGEDKIMPGEEEIAAYNKSFESYLQKTYDTHIQIRNLARTLLDKNSYTPQDEGVIRNILNFSEHNIGFFEERRDLLNGNGDAEKLQVHLKAEREMAESMIRNWKINQALYTRFGGGIVIQPSGVLPLDAYKKFVEKIRENLKINDSAYNGIFDEFLSFIQEEHNHKIDQKATKDYFNTPYWLEGQQKEIRELEGIKKKLLTIQPTGQK